MFNEDGPKGPEDCGDGTNFSPQCDEVYDDGMDNDGDGLTDCDEVCDDANAINSDGTVDCEDANSAPLPLDVDVVGLPVFHERDCSDGIDNDGDGLTDCDDENVINSDGTVDCGDPGVFMNYSEIADEVSTQTDQCTEWRPKCSPLPEGDNCPTGFIKPAEVGQCSDDEPSCKPTDDDDTTN